VLTSDSPVDGVRPYSTRLRTAIVLTGTGTAGAYHAGVLRAFHEAGLRLDLIAARGIGAVGAMFAAVDGGQRLWDRNGLWKGGSLARAYRWRMPLRVTGWALAVATALLATPLVLFGIGVLVALIAVLLKLLTFDSASTAVTAGYARTLDALFAPAALPTIVPGLIVVCLLVALGASAVSLGLSMWHAPVRRRVRDGAVWRLLGAPLSSALLLERATAELWNLIRGAAAIAPPPRPDLGKRYVELLAENLGQPGFRELLLVTHDMDARRDVLFALLGDTHRQRFFARAPADGARAAEAFDLAGVGREHAIDALAAALAIPVATDPHLLRFPADGPWRGETHRLCDRPGSLGRVLDEVAAAGAEQVIVLSAAPPPGRPHELSAGRGDLRGRAAEQLSSFEASDLRDAVARIHGRVTSVFVIRPAHNPLGPLDFGGVYDERSDRHYSVAELVDRGYEDAYHQFIDPVVAGSGERIETVQS
jgi:hypothetical protein